ncbi:MAG: peptidoglycan-associated lipoprotein Pal [Candidatus Sumerlaeota bacterium]
MLSRSRSLSILLLLSLVAATTLTTTACGKKKLKPEVRVASNGLKGGGLGSGADGMGGSGAPDAYGFGGSGTMGSGANGSGSAGAFDKTGSRLNNGNENGVENGQFSSELEMIHFDYDSSEISDAWKSTLDKHAQWINANPTILVQVQGHCDEKGTDEYNIALGQKRADAVREYLAADGVDGSRMSTISYGKQRPLTFDATDESSALNRRAMFLVYENESTGTPVAAAQ